MTRRANHIVDTLRRQGRVAGLSPDVLLRVLRSHGLRPSEAGWVLHHTFGVSMPEAVHRAEVAHLRAGTELLGEAPPPEVLRDEVDLAGAVRLVAG